MSLWSKISENKFAVLATAGAAVLGGAIYWAYKQYESEEGTKVEKSTQPSAIREQSKQFDLRAEINKLKSEVNLGDLDIEDIKKIFKLMAAYVKSKTLAVAGKYKEERRKRFPKETRFIRMPEYMRETADSLMQIQNMMMQLQNQQGQIMASFGLNQGTLARYAAQLGPFMQELQVQELDLNGGISLENTRLYLQLKTEYLEAHGERLIEAVIELSSSLPLQEKQLIPIFLNTFITDEVFEHQPNLDREEFELAAEHYKTALNAQIISYEKAIMPLMGKLQTVLASDQNALFGGMGGYGGAEEYDNGMGGMGGFSEEAMQAQLQAIRQQDPQAYEQLMAMMQAQMGR